MLLENQFDNTGTFPAGKMRRRTASQGPRRSAQRVAHVKYIILRNTSPSLGTTSVTEAAKLQVREEKRERAREGRGSTTEGRDAAT